MSTVKKVLELFEELSLSTESKAQKLQEFFPGNTWFEEEIGVIVGDPRKADVIIVSHYDLIPIFDEAFATKSKNAKLRLKKDAVTGALDNTITNAALVHVAQKAGLSARVALFFSNMEEIGAIGVRNFFRKFELENRPFFVNLDVTNDNWGSQGVSIEYDDPNPYAWSLFEEAPFKKGMQDVRFFDDTDAILKAGYNGLSFCLPTKGMIHGFGSSTTTERIEEFVKALGFVYNDLPQKLEEIER